MCIFARSYYPLFTENQAVNASYREKRDFNGDWKRQINNQCKCTFYSALVFHKFSKHKQKMQYLSAQIILYTGCKNIWNFDAIQKQNGDINQGAFFRGEIHTDFYFEWKWYAAALFPRRGRIYTGSFFRWKTMQVKSPFYNLGLILSLNWHFLFF